MADSLQVPFNKPGLVGTELDLIRAALESGRTAGDGDYTRACQRLLEQTLGARHALLTTSGTDALELAALLLDIAPGDEVIMPSFTFASTANAFCLRGAVPRFVDIRADTLNLDERQVEAAITPRTRAIVPVHYAGVACEMDELLALSARHGVPLVEDAAQAVHATYRGRALGTLGALGCLSFHETKTLIAGEGGALLVNDDALVRRAEILREKGTNRAAFVRGEVDKYTWVDLGSSFLPSELIAAFLLAQLQRAEAIIATRRRIYERYAETLAPLAAAGVVRLPVLPADRTINYHMFYLLTADADTRDRLQAHLRAAGVQALFHYTPLHASPMGRRYGAGDAPLPVTDRTAACLLRLPLYNELDAAAQEHVVARVAEFFGLRAAV